MVSDVVTARSVVAEILLAHRLFTLTNELREMQPTHRGACLEAVAAISESHLLSATVLQGDAEGAARYRASIVRVVAFAVEKLNDKGESLSRLW